MNRKIITTVLLLSLFLCFASEARANVIFIPPIHADFCGEPLPLESDYVAEAFEEAFLSFAYFHSRTIILIKKTDRFFPYVESRLKARKMPEDLKYIMVVESFFNSHAVSPARAVGFWQFIEPTAKRMGLRVDSSIDERRNLERSTEAALDYLSALYTKFGSWTLAAAAYNCGETRVAAAINEQGQTSYYDLKLPTETEMYIPRIVALKTILASPSLYGFTIAKSRRYRPVPTVSVDIFSEKEILLLDIARQYQTTIKMIRELNPEIRGNKLPGGSYRIKLPPSNYLPGDRNDTP
ncbi:MAG: lytic transglycosylase domain-containing protein [Deltaproteobacteria bacterium]|nr:lytic transglycosylase domain-containing protein [Deltaproteobacteria bacterium]